MNKDQIKSVYKKLQENIVEGLQKLDPLVKVKVDEWKRAAGGGGTSMAMSGDHILSKGGVNFSAVHGETPEKILHVLNLSKSDFFATGVSIVLHPNNPFVPIIHMNVRYFEMSNGVWWFGGGIDLTPHYINILEAQNFHKHLKTICDQTDKTFYGRFKSNADDYFFLKHRKETRGIGGIFYDHLNEKSGYSKKELLQFSLDVGNGFVAAYQPLMEANSDRSFTKKEKEWQLMRRGRYVEFNLVWDKGTKFGLDTNGRTESILISMPPLAKWTYQFPIEENSKEAQTLAYLKKNINWLTIKNA